MTIIESLIFLGDYLFFCDFLKFKALQTLELGFLQIGWANNPILF